MSDVKFRYEIHPRVPMRNVLDKAIIKPTVVELTMGQVRECLKYGPVYRRFNADHIERVTAFTINALHQEKFDPEALNNTLSKTEEVKHSKIRFNEEKKVKTPVIEEKVVEEASIEKVAPEVVEQVETPEVITEEKEAEAIEEEMVGEEAQVEVPAEGTSVEKKVEEVKKEELPEAPEEEVIEEEKTPESSEKENVTEVTEEKENSSQQSKSDYYTGKKKRHH